MGCHQVGEFPCGIISLVSSLIQASLIMPSKIKFNSNKNNQHKSEHLGCYFNLATTFQEKFDGWMVDDIIQTHYDDICTMAQKNITILSVKNI